jgi:C4-dicarboxylate-specific signal transduction histidine kinase
MAASLAALEIALAEAPQRGWLSAPILALAAVTRIIDHMRIFGRKPTEAPTIFDLGETVRSAAEFFGETARLRGFQLDLSLDPNLQVSGHPALIEQVVANILSNAFAALSTAGVASPVVTVLAARRDKQIRVVIADNAGGVPADVLPHIFEPFFTTKSDREGTGLGLSISYGIIANMGGRLEAENRKGGAVFSFELPDASPSPPAVESRRTIPVS